MSIQKISQVTKVILMTSALSLGGCVLPYGYSGAPYYGYGGYVPYYGNYGYGRRGGYGWGWGGGWNHGWNGNRGWGWGGGWNGNRGGGWGGGGHHGGWHHGFNKWDSDILRPDYPAQKHVFAGRGHKDIAPT